MSLSHSQSLFGAVGTGVTASAANINAVDLLVVVGYLVVLMVAAVFRRVPRPSSGARRGLACESVQAT